MTDTQTLILILVAAFLAVAILLWLVKGRKQAVTLADPAEAPLERRTFQPATKPLAVPAEDVRPPAVPVAPVPVAAEPEGDGVADEVAAAVENVVGQFIGIDAHHDKALDGDPAAADVLVSIKGLGPKAAARLNELGITRYDQLAALSDAEADALDAQMGTFRGRMARDRWIEQAGHLAVGDRDRFEAKFGRIG